MLGNIFLKHIERTKILVYMIDINDESYKDSFKVLFNELKSHDSSLVKKPSIIFITKTDTVNIQDFKINKNLNDLKILAISSVSKDGIKEALSSIVALIKCCTSHFSYILLLNKNSIGIILNLGNNIHIQFNWEVPFEVFKTCNLFT